MLFVWGCMLLVTMFQLHYVQVVLRRTGEVIGIPFLEQPAVWLLFVVICLGGFFFSIYTFLIGFYGDKEFKSIVKDNSIGFIKISAATFENIVLNVIRKLGGIKDARAVIKINEGEVSVIVHATFLADVNIPVLCEESQSRIVQSIEQCTGVKTSSVKMIVDGVQHAYRGRVE